MKTKKLIKSSLYLNLIFIIPVIVFLLSVVTGCSASKKIKATKTEVAPLLRRHHHLLLLIPIWKKKFRM